MQVKTPVSTLPQEHWLNVAITATLANDSSPTRKHRDRYT